MKEKRQLREERALNRGGGGGGAAGKGGGGGLQGRLVTANADIKRMQDEFGGGDGGKGGGKKGGGQLPQDK